MSNEAKTKVEMDPKYIIKLTVTLFLTCVVVAGLLGGVNAITADKIAASNQAKTEAALAAVFEGASAPSFPEVEVTDAMSAAASAAGGTLQNAYEVQDGGAVLGHAMKVVASGSQGNIEMIVGVDADGAITGVSIVSNSETGGIGSKVMENKPNDNGVGVLDQFVGMSGAGSLVVKSNITPISGATVSTNGVTAGANAALAAVEALG